jgi:hypothetical protein
MEGESDRTKFSKSKILKNFSLRQKNVIIFAAKKISGVNNFQAKKSGSAGFNAKMFPLL